MGNKLPCQPLPPRSDRGEPGTNTIFLLALFVATAVATVQGTVQTVEILVLLQLSFGFIFSILSIWGHRTRAPQGEKQPIRFPLIPSFARLALTTALSSYAVWFWFFGYTILHARPGCSDYVFLFARVNASESAGIFFKVQSTLILVAFGILFAREVLMVICFFCFVALWTPVIATVTVLFSAWGVQRHEEDRRRRNAMLDGHLAVEEMKRLKVKLTAVTLWRSLIQWLRISLAMFWKQTKGKESAGPKRPTLSLYLVPFYDLWILVLRTSFQFVCLLIFNRCPPIGFPPMIQHPIIRVIRRIKNPKARGSWLKRVQDMRKQRWLQWTVYGLNTACIIWTIISVELTLVWNQVSGVYTINSTGQLIPFVTAVVAFVKLMHAMSVHHSKIWTTDVLMGLLDVDPPPDDSSERSHLTEGLDEGVYPLQDDFEAVFWKRTPPRRHSIQVITDDLLELDQTGRRLPGFSYPNEGAGVDRWATPRFSADSSAAISSGRAATPLDNAACPEIAEHQPATRGRSRSRQRKERTRHRSTCTRSTSTGRTSGSASDADNATSNLFRRVGSFISRFVLSSFLRGFLLVVLCIAKCLVPPVSRLWSLLKPRIRVAFKEYIRRSSDHYVGMVGDLAELLKGYKRPLDEESQARHDSEDVVAADRSPRISWVQYAPAHLRKRTTFDSVWSALGSRSLPKAIQMLAVIVSRYCTRVNMPQTAENFNRIAALWDEAKVVRMEHNENKIGRTVQHEKMAEKWHAVWDKDIFEVLIRENDASRLNKHAPANQKDFWTSKERPGRARSRSASSNRRRSWDVWPTPYRTRND